MKTHLTLLESASHQFADLPAFKLPNRDPHTNALLGWRTISYAQFRRDVERAAKYWIHVLSGIPLRSAVGLWIGGWTYDDLLHIYGMSRAGYVPQLFTIRLPNPDVIFELLAKSNAKALVIEASFSAVVSNPSLPVHVALPLDELTSPQISLPELPSHLPDDIAFYLHTSGSTSGSPKVIPYTHAWLDFTVAKCAPMVPPCKEGKLDVATWIGSFCHVAQTAMFIGHIQHGACTLLPSQPGFGADELAFMSQSAGVNRLCLFSPFLERHLRSAKSDAKVLSLLQAMDEVICCGGLLPREQEEWAAKNGINVKNLFGSTECGPTLISKGGYGADAGHLRASEGSSYAFVPTGGSSEAAGYQSTARLLEFVVLSDSPDCPPVQFRSPIDGHFHTGDLFQAASPGGYVFRGRDDDWIKTENALRCDTKAIEDNVRIVCGDLITECVVVGSGRPSPALLVEPAGDIDHEKLKKEIIRKTRHFHSRRYLHERISSPNFIIVVPPSSLPRTATKGNVRRKQAEEKFISQLDEVYARLKV